MATHKLKSGNVFELDIDNIDAINLMQFKKFFYKCLSGKASMEDIVFILLSHSDIEKEIQHFCQGIGTFNGSVIDKDVLTSKAFVLSFEEVIHIVFEEFTKLISLNEDTKKKNASTLN